MRDLPVHSAIDLSHARKAPTIAVAGLERDRNEPRLAVLASVMRLLKEAAEALQRDAAAEAHQYVEKAAALLRDRSTFGATETGTSSGPTRCRLAPWQVARTTAFVDANVANKIGIEDLANVARLSTSHFSRAFRATVGVTPHAYVIRRRVERAQDLIRGGDKSLSEIALDCGLADQAHLTKVFRRLVGVSPGAWRRRQSLRGEIGGSKVHSSAVDRPIYQDVPCAA